MRFAGLGAERCSYVWNGVDLSRFGDMAPTARQASDPFMLISVGRLHPMKGYDYLIEALGKLKDKRLSLILIGSGAEETHLKRLAIEWGVSEQIDFRGHVEDPETYLRMSHCFVLPSVSHESCPAVVPEAMACGLPVITSDFGPLPEININGETGIVVPCRSADGLASAICRIADSPQVGEEYGGAGRRRAQEQFSRQRMISEMMRLYQRVIAGTF